jgi:hypothetical protein
MPWGYTVRTLIKMMVEQSAYHRYFSAEAKLIVQVLRSRVPVIISKENTEARQLPRLQL